MEPEQALDVIDQARKRLMTANGEDHDMARMALTVLAETIQKYRSLTKDKTDGNSDS